MSIRKATDDGDRGNLLGALLRLAHQDIISRVMAGMRAAGYEDIEQAHVSVLRPAWDYPEGVRATVLAAEARITKQSAGALIDHVEARGYVERIPDPTDGRAKLVRLTRRGRTMGKRMREIVRETEADWAARVGRERIETMRATLTDLVHSLADRAPRE